GPSRPRTGATGQAKAPGSGGRGRGLRMKIPNCTRRGISLAKSKTLCECPHTASRHIQATGDDKLSSRHRSTITVMAVAVALALPGGQADAQDAQVPTVQATASTQRTASGENNDAAIVRNDARPGASRIIATAALDGLEISDLSGKRLATVPAGEAAAVDAMPGVAIGKRSTTVVAAVDETGHFLRLYTFDNDRLAEAGARPIPLGFAAEGICLFRSPQDGALQAFIVGDGGEIDQQVIHATADGRLDARQVRRIHLPSPLTQCVADAAGHVYVSEEAVGIWRFNADAEADTEARVVDAPRLGHIEEE